MQKRFLLLNPCIFDFAAYDFWMKPLGLLCLAELLRRAGSEVTLLDCLDRHDPGWLRWQRKSAAHERWDGTGKFHREPIAKPAVFRDVPRRYCRYGWSPEYLRQRLLTLPRPDAVLVTSHMTYWYPGVQEAIHLLKEIWAGVPVVLGGIYATLCREHAESHSGADLVLPGPLVGGTLRTLWDFLELSRLPADDWFAGLEELPYHLYPNLRSAAVVSTIGCPYRCSFCASWILQPRYQRRDPRVVAKEIWRLHRMRGVRHFAFFDDALLIDSGRHFLPMCEELARHKLRASFHTPNGLHIREITQEVAQAMAAVGFRTIRLSYETSNPERQAAMGGKVTDAELEAALQNLERAGYQCNEIGVYVMAALPGQAVREVVETLLVVANLGAKSSLAVFSPIPGTLEWRRAVELGLFPEDADPLLTNDTRVPIRSEEFNLISVQRLRHAAKWLNSKVEGSKRRFPSAEDLTSWVLDPRRGWQLPESRTTVGSGVYRPELR